MPTKPSPETLSRLETASRRLEMCIQSMGDIEVAHAEHDPSDEALCSLALLIEKHTPVIEKAMLELAEAFVLWRDGCGLGPSDK